jgi:hypothetical protein
MVAASTIAYDAAEVIVSVTHGVRPAGVAFGSFCQRRRKVAINGGKVALHREKLL